MVAPSPVWWPLQIRFRDLRHTCATILLSRGVHARLVQELLGHATVSITLDTYSHALPGMDDGLADAMGDALGCRRSPVVSGVVSIGPSVFAGASLYCAYPAYLWGILE